MSKAVRHLPAQSVSFWRSSLKPEPLLPRERSTGNHILHSQLHTDRSAVTAQDWKTATCLIGETVSPCLGKSSIYVKGEQEKREWDNLYTSIFCEVWTVAWGTWQILPSKTEAGQSKYWRGSKIYEWMLHLLSQSYNCQVTRTFCAFKMGIVIFYSCYCKSSVYCLSIPKMCMCSQVY